MESDVQGEGIEDRTDHECEERVVGEVWRKEGGEDVMRPPP